MPFENFYEESDKAAYRWRLFLGLAFCFWLSTSFWLFRFSHHFFPQILPMNKTKNQQNPKDCVMLTDFAQICRIQKNFTL
jgi:hypothetical protein